MKPTLKLCGFRTKEEIELLLPVATDVDVIGFIFVPGRRRAITADHYKQLLPIIPSRIKKAAVFQNAGIKEICEVLSVGGFDFVQLHGNETVQLCQQIKRMFHVEMIKSVSVRPDVGPEILTPFVEHMDIVLLDQGKGGSGTSFTWGEILKYHSFTKEHDRKLWVAGGIHSGNLPQLLTDYHVDGVDISSGIESNGQKDQMKIREVIEIIERMNRR